MRSMQATWPVRARPHGAVASHTDSRSRSLPALREKNFGTWEGLPDDRDPRTLSARERRPRGDAETSEELAERVLTSVREIAARHPGGRVLVVSHGGPLRAIFATALAGGDGQSPTATSQGSASRTAVSVDRLTPPVEDYTNKYKGEQIEIALFGGEYQEGVLTAYCSIEDVPHIELNGHILVPLQNVASLHCSSRCDAPEPDWPPRGLGDDERDVDGLELTTAGGARPLNIAKGGCSRSMLAALPARSAGRSAGRGRRRSSSSARCWPQLPSTRTPTARCSGCSAPASTRSPRTRCCAPPSTRSQRSSGSHRRSSI